MLPTTFKWQYETPICNVIHYTHDGLHSHVKSIDKLRILQKPLQIVTPHTAWKVLTTKWETITFIRTSTRSALAEGKHNCFVTFVCACTWFRGFDWAWRKKSMRCIKLRRILFIFPKEWILHFLKWNMILFLWNLLLLIVRYVCKQMFKFQGKI